MDFDPAFTDNLTVLDEFKQKYTGSYVLINDEVVYLDKISSAGFVAINNGVATIHHYEDKTTIKHITFKPGLFTNKEGTKLAYGYKFPARQYCKGIKLGVSHSLSPLIGVLELRDAIYIGNHTIFNDKVYIYWNIVGTYNKHVITLFDEFKHLKPECEELWPRYVII